MKRRILAMLLVAVMALSFAFSASAADNTDYPQNPTNDDAWRAALLQDDLFTYFGDNYYNTNGAIFHEFTKSANLKSVAVGGIKDNLFVGWYKDANGSYHYFDNSGVAVRSKWVGDYYLTDTGIMATNTWIGNYYVGSDGKYIPNAQYSGWKWDKKGWTYYLPSGVQAKNGWFKITWIDENTTRENGVTEIKGSTVRSQELKNGTGYWYYFNSKGYLLQDAWIGDYHVGKDGIMDTDTFIFNKNGYNWFVDANGKWIKDYLTQTFDFDFVERGTFDSMSLKAGYIDINGNWHGVKNDWYTDADGTYYFNSEGFMVKSQWIGDYYVDADGYLVKATADTAAFYKGMDAFTNANSGSPIRKVGSYYVDNTGKAVKNVWVAGVQGTANEGKWYYIGSDYKLTKEAWVGDYYVGGDGAMLKNTWIGDYYVGNDGKYVK